ncbi:Hypothetical protein, putative [Bodo saltans]|uniref:Uncharacterized protein n=1 Tax=Bodo saltans TaxID=75058 RepID=A0A0S4IQD9_BODSA|nr:Hypothetical protein, putative [Bodo saltans]|eukprot:CUE72986.1 Hypothetical protein, putative [Bodo saltans]
MEGTRVQGGNFRSQQNVLSTSFFAFCNQSQISPRRMTEMLLSTNTANFRHQKEHPPKLFDNDGVVMYQLIKTKGWYF